MSPARSCRSAAGAEREAGLCRQWREWREEGGRFTARFKCLRAPNRISGRRMVEGFSFMDEERSAVDARSASASICDKDHGGKTRPADPARFLLGALRPETKSCGGEPARDLRSGQGAERRRCSVRPSIGNDDRRRSDPMDQPAGFWPRLLIPAYAGAGEFEPFRLRGLFFQMNSQGVRPFSAFRLRAKFKHRGSRRRDAAVARDRRSGSV